MVKHWWRGIEKKGTIEIPSPGHQLELLERRLYPSCWGALPMPKDSSLPLTEIARQGWTKLQYVQRSHGKHVSAMDCALILSGRPVFFFYLVNRHEIFSLLFMYSLNSLIFLFPVLAVKKHYFDLNYVGGLGQSRPDWKKIIEVNTEKPFWNSWKNFSCLPYDILLFIFSTNVLDTCWPRMHV